MTRKSKSATRARTSRLWGLYITAWMVLAAGALSYLILAATDPQMARRILPIQTAMATAPDGRHAQAGLTTELETLNKNVSDLGARVAAVQSTVAEHERAFEMIAKKVDAVASARETAATPPQTLPITLGSVRTVPITPERPAPPQNRGRGNTKLPPLPTRVVRRAPPPQYQPPARAARAGSPNAPRIINRNQPEANEVTTGSLPPRQRAGQPPQSKTAAPTTPPAQRKSEVQFGTPLIKAPVLQAPSAPTAISLGRALSLNELQATWEQLVSRHPALLGGLQPRYSQDRSGAFILLAGPLNDHTHAGRLCEALRSSGVGCGINPFTGNAL